MTMREEFEAWHDLYMPDDESPRKIAWSAWQAAYRAGQEAYRKGLKPVASVHYRVRELDGGKLLCATLHEGVDVKAHDLLYLLDDQP